jgi:hypothetical protein
MSKNGAMSKCRFLRNDKQKGKRKSDYRSRFPSGMKKQKGKRKSKYRNRFPSGMTNKRATATATATTATETDSLRE